MALVLSSEGEAIMLRYLVNQAKPEDLMLHLYVNDFTPDPEAVREDFDEPSGSGYAPIPLRGELWSLTGRHPTLAQCSEQAFTLGPIGKVYGYFVTREHGGELVYGERFPGEPRNAQDPRTQILVTPRFTQNSEQ